MPMYTRHILFLIALLFGITQIASAQNPTLILQTSPQETEIEIESSVSLLANGDLRATPVDKSICQTTNTCEGVTVSVTNFNSTSANNRTLTVDEGSAAILAWQSVGATACDAQGTFSGWTSKGALPPDSRDATSAQVTVPTASGDAAGSPYELKLQCRNGSVASTVSATSTLSLVVNEVVAPSPTSCEGREPITGWTRLTTGSLGCLLDDSSADCREWSPNLWPNPFLESNGLTRKILTNRSDQRQYVAIRFNTNNMSPTQDGRINLESAGGSVRKEPLIVTISKCPGDFNPDQVTGCYFTPLFSFRWRGPQSSSSASCILEPDTVYYLNMLSSSSASGTLPQNIQPVEACDSALCGVLLQTN